MNKGEMIEKLADLLKLCEELDSYSQYGSDHWVEQGILTAEELAEWTQIEHVDLAIDKRVREATDAVHRPVVIYTKEYQSILDRMAELQPVITQVETIQSALTNLNYNEFDGNLWYNARHIFNRTKSPEEIEYQELREKAAGLERKGSKVEKGRTARFTEYAEALDKVKAQTLATLQAEYATQLARKHELDGQVERRLRDKKAPILQQIDALLESVVEVAK